MPNKDETKFQMSLDDETIYKINTLSMGLNVSMGNAIRFMINHYLRFCVIGAKPERFELDDISSATRGHSLLESPALRLNERFEHEDKYNEKDNLIETLKTNITGKEMIINQLASDFVSISKKLDNANKILGGVEDLILCSER